MHGAETERDMIMEAFTEGTIIDDALAEAVEHALRDHKRAGNPIVVWRDGKVVWIPANEIVLPEDAAD